MTREQYNFDELIDRRNTDSLKYDCRRQYRMPEDVIPLWVADMDFKSPPCVQEALTHIAEAGVFGYSEPQEPYYEAVLGWYRSQFGWEAERRWIVKTPGVVFAIAAALEAFTEPGDAVMIQRPVYYPFSQVISGSGRKLVNSALVERKDTGRYEMNFEEIEEKLISEQVKVFLLCSPHNPVGRVWTKEELRRLGELCRKHGVLVVSDEIHSDFVWEGHKHTIFTEAGEEFADFSVICTAPSKTFNLAGLQNSNIFIPNTQLRRKFRAVTERLGMELVGQMGLAACRAAYEGGQDWLKEVKQYIWSNIRYLDDYLKENIPEIRMIVPEGTYLVWLDCRDLGLDDATLDRLIVERARLWLDAGTIFGTEGSGFQRINAACPREVLQRAMEQLRGAVAEVRSL